jgi:DNA polymerase III sliding clamp (beta) subunit (PCNA family)
MGVKATFECATIQDVVAKAAKIAPTKGATLAQAAGLLIQLRPNEEPNCIVKATNTSVWYTEWTEAVEITGFDDVDWRVGSQLLAQLLKTFPMAQGATCTFEVTDKEPGLLAIKNQRSVTKLHLLDSQHYPKWEAFDPEGLKVAKDFAARMTQVGWAVQSTASGTDTIAMSGVYVDGTSLNATDRYRLARVPCEVPIDKGVIIPPQLVDPVLKNTSDVRVGVAGGKFYLMPDESTQIVATTIDAAYPPIEKAMRREFPYWLDINVPQLKGMIDRMMLMAGSDRFPRLDLTIGNERMHLKLLVEDAAESQDELPLDGQAIHDDYTIFYQPKILLSCLNAAPGDQIKLGYDPTKPRAPFYILGASGFESWAMPRVGSEQS